MFNELLCQHLSIFNQRLKKWCFSSYLTQVFRGCSRQYKTYMWGLPWGILLLKTPMGLLPYTLNCGLCMRQECRERFPCRRLQSKVLVSDPSVVWNTECSPECSVVVGWLAPAECDVLGLRRSVLRNREIWGASFVFWPGSADCVDVCSGEADSPWCVLAVVCPTGDSVQRICVTESCRVLRYRLWVVRPVTMSSGVFVCDREIWYWAYKGRMSTVSGELCWETWGVFTSMVAAIYEPRLAVGHLFTSLWGPFKNFETGCVAPSLVVFIGQSQTPFWKAAGQDSVTQIPR